MDFTSNQGVSAGIYSNAIGCEIQEDDDPDTVHGAQPYWLDRSHGFGPVFDSDIEKGDGESGSSGSGVEGEPNPDLSS